MMKFKSLIAAMALLLSSVTTQAATVFYPADGNVNFFFDNLGGYNLYIFDDSVAVSSMTTDNGLLVSVPEDISFVSSPPTASGTHGTLDFSGNTNFVLGLTMDILCLSNCNFITDNGGSLQLGPTAYQVTFTDTEDGAQLSVVASDIAPVPLPAAVWLFGAGLLGLVGVARRHA